MKFKNATARIGTTTLREWLQCKFQPGEAAEILLHLHEKFQPGLKYKPPCFRENSPAAHAHVIFSACAKIPFWIHRVFADFSTCLPGLKLSPLHGQFHFKGISFRIRAEISAWAEIRHVINPPKTNLTDWLPSLGLINKRIITSSSYLFYVICLQRGEKNCFT